MAGFRHLLEAEVSSHFEMSLQVPRKEKENSCCWHRQLFPQIAQPVQLAHLADESRKVGPYLAGRWGRLGRASETACLESMGWLPLFSLLPSPWDFGQRRCERAFPHLQRCSPRLHVEDSKV